MTAIYARQSIERRDSVSIHAQIDQCRRFAAGEYQVYQDAGYSGKNTRRPQFEKLMADIATGKVDTVVSYRLDRITRNIMDFAALLQLFETHGVKYISATEQLDTSTPMGRAMVYIVMVFAQLERETIAGRILDNYRFRAGQGLYMGGNAPYGYRGVRVEAEGRMISVLEPGEESGTLRQIFDWYAGGGSLGSISRRLNQEGVSTAKGNQWTPKSVRRVLENITPCAADDAIYSYLVESGYQVASPPGDFDGLHGMCIFFKNKDRNRAANIPEQVAVVGVHPPLIPSRQFLAVQGLLDRSASPVGKRSRRTFLSGLIRCGQCGCSVGVKYTSRNGREYAYYHCRGRHSRGLCQNRIYVPVFDLEAAVLEACRRHLAAAPLRPARTVTASSGPSSSALGIQAQIDNLINGVGRGTVAVDQLLAKRIALLQARLEALDPPPGISAPMDVSWTRRRFGVSFEELSIEEKASLIRCLVQGITMDGSGQITLEFLF